MFVEFVSCFFIPFLLLYLGIHTITRNPATRAIGVFLLFLWVYPTYLFFEDHYSLFGEQQCDNCRGDE